MKTITFIIHGNLKKKDNLILEIKAKASGQFKVVTKETSGVGDAMLLSRTAVDSGTNYLIAVGGDGTVNEVLNGAMQANEQNRSKLLVGVLPGGTGNDFSKSIHAEGGIDQLFEYILSDTSFNMDLGWMRFRDHDGKNTERYFGNIADVGIGGQVVMNTAKAGKWMGPDMIYFTSILKSFIGYKHQRMRLTAPGHEWEGKVLSLIFANARFFGSGLCIAPEADLQDGQMELINLADVSLFDYLKNMSKVKRGEKIEHPEVSYHRFPNCRVISLEDPVPIDMDGEFVGYTPLEVVMEKGVIQILGKIPDSHKP